MRERERERARELTFILGTDTHTHTGLSENTIISVIVGGIRIIIIIDIICTDIYTLFPVIAALYMY